MANLNSLWEDDICFCGNHEDCPKKDKCLRAYKYNKPGIYTMAAFYNSDNKECEYFIERDKNA